VGLTGPSESFETAQDQNMVLNLVEDHEDISRTMSLGLYLALSKEYNPP
jgi:hypothetical protein